MAVTEQLVLDYPSRNKNHQVDKIHEATIFRHWTIDNVRLIHLKRVTDEVVPIFALTSASEQSWN